MYWITKKSGGSRLYQKRNSIMADTLIAGTTLVEKESRSVGDIPVGGVIEWDDTFSSIPEGFVLADGSTISDPLSSYNGSAVPDLNTQYISINPVDFSAIYPATDTMIHDPANGATDITTAGDDPIMMSGVNIPNEAVVTGAIVFGADVTNAWDLRRTTASNKTTSDMATAAVNTEDTTISNATIDNSLYNYWFYVLAGVNDEIYGARLTYTPRLKFIIRIR